MTVDSRIRIHTIGPDSITLDFAQLRVHYVEQGERIRDRLGLVHRIIPNMPRYPIQLTIRLVPEELTRMNDYPVRAKTVLEFFDKYFRQQSEVVIFSLGVTLAEGGSTLTRNLAYKGYIDELPLEYFGTLPVVGGGPEQVEVGFSVHEDGTFSDFGDLGSYSAYTPARP